MPALPRGPLGEITSETTTIHSDTQGSGGPESTEVYTTQYQYDPADRRLANLNTQSPVSGDIQKLAYQYDDVGNITRIQNNVPIPSPNQIGGPPDQTFQYDQLYRLKNATGLFQYQPNKKNLYTLDLNYDRIHNLTQKNQVHKLQSGGNQGITQQKTSYNATYQYTGPKPHAASLIGDRTYTYDPSGNLSASQSIQNANQRTILWDEENRAQEITDGGQGGGQTTTFKYDEAGQRVIKRGAHGESAYVNQFFVVRNRTIATKHIDADGFLRRISAEGEAVIACRS